MSGFEKKKSWLAQCTNISWVKGLSTMKQKVYSEPCEISGMERFEKNVILDVWQGSKYNYDEAISSYIS